MQLVLAKNRLFWTQRALLTQTLFGVLIIGLSLVVNFYANAFTATHASNPVSDILLDNIPVFDVDFIYAQGIFIFSAVLLIILVYEPSWLPFVLKSIGIFILVRAFAMVLTHIAPPMDASPQALNAISHKLSVGTDLFFSAHTGMPFLIALIFWHKKLLRALFLVFTAIGAAVVILGHLHYSIDVFSAFFITFGVFALAKTFFASDYALGIEADLRSRSLQAQQG